MLKDIFNFVEDIVNKTVDKKQSKVKYVDVSDSFESLKEVDSFQKVSVVIKNLDLRFVYSKQFKVSMFLSDNCDIDKLKLKIEQSKERLTINVSYNADKANGYMVIKSSSLDDVEVKADNGDVLFEKIKADAITSRSANGDVVFDSNIFKNANIVSHNGDVVVHLAEPCKFSLNSSNGEIIREGVKSKDSSDILLYCTAENGDIVIKK